MASQGRSAASLPPLRGECQAVSEEIQRVRDVLSNPADVRIPDDWPEWGDDDGFGDLGPVSADPPVRKTKMPPKKTDDPHQIEVTEDGVARAFTDRYGGTLRFDHDIGKWFEFNGKFWEQDGTGRASDYCRMLAREASLGLTGKDLATVRRSSFASGVERFARTDRAHAVTQDAWDNDPWLIGTPSETVDLRTGTMRPADAADGITKVTACSPANTEDCSRWHQFIEDITGGDDGLSRFLAQWAGYSLTGDTREQSLAFFYGPGGNGKSAFVSTISAILGDYVQAASMATFVKTSADRHPTDLASLRGARLVTASETEQGRAWDESRIKVLTGGDTIAARFMRQDFFEFTPQFKLTIVGNHRPTLGSVDDAIRRRFLMVPFLRKPDRPDPQLGEKLKAEYPGILRWMINGCIDWQENGLVRPQQVLAATNEYFSEQDTFGQWISEECRTDTGAAKDWETARDLFENWSAFARAAGEDPGTQKRFGDELGKRGLRRDQRRVEGKTPKVWVGISLRRKLWSSDGQ